MVEIGIGTREQCRLVLSREGVKEVIRNQSVRVIFYPTIVTFEAHIPTELFFPV